MHQQGECICQKGLLWSQKHLTACGMMVKDGSASEENKGGSGVTMLTLGVSKK